MQVCIVHFFNLVNKISTMKRAFIFLLVMLALGACRKAEIPDDIQESPVFNVGFLIDGNDHSLEAGVDGQYLFTSFDRDHNDVVTMRGAFADASCPDASCKGSFIFELRNYVIGDVAPSPNDSSVIHSGYFGFEYFRRPATDSAGFYRSKLTFTLDNPDPSTSYNWAIQQTPNVDIQGFTPEIWQEFTDTVTPVEINLSYLTESGFSSNGHFQYRFGATAAPCPQVVISATPDTLFSDNYKLVAHVTPPIGNYDFSWNVAGATDSVLVVDSTDLGTIKSVTVTDANGCTASSSVLNYNSGTGFNKSALVYVNREDFIVNNPLQLGTVAITWVQPEVGTVWRSDGAIQPSNSYIQILDCQHYDPNENGEKTDRFTFNFRCLLFNADGASIPMVGSGVMAVAYP